MGERIIESLPESCASTKPLLTTLAHSVHY